MTANSTYWMEDNPENGLTILYGLPQKFTQQKSAHNGVWRGDPDSPRWAGRSGGNEGDFRIPDFTSEDAVGDSLSDICQLIVTGSRRSHESLG